MLKVRLIDDDWSSVPAGSFVEKVLVVGDPLPIKGMDYTVKSKFIHAGEVYYELDGFDYSAYGTIGFFKANRFTIVEQRFVPNHVCEATGFLAEKVIYHIELLDFRAD